MTDWLLTVINQAEMSSLSNNTVTSDKKESHEYLVLCRSVCEYTLTWNFGAVHGTPQYFRASWSYWIF